MLTDDGEYLCRCERFEPVEDGYESRQANRCPCENYSHIGHGRKRDIPQHGLNHSAKVLRKDRVNFKKIGNTKPTLDPARALFDENRLWSVKEAAGYMGLSPWTLYSWTANGKLPFRKAGKRILFSKQELDIWTRQGNQGNMNPSLNLISQNPK